MSAAALTRGRPSAGAAMTATRPEAPPMSTGSGGTAIEAQKQRQVSPEA